MKAIRNFVILSGLSVMLLALAATSSQAQIVEHARFVGTFTMPFDAQWGSMTLPAGDYSLRYGRLYGTGTLMVEVSAREGVRPHGFAFTIPGNQVKTSENALICIREGNNGYVRELRMGAVGESARFAVPHGVIVRARVVAEGKHNANTQHAESRMSIVRVPVKLSAK